MAFPTIEGRASSTQAEGGGNDHTVSLPTGIQSGDLLIAAIAVAKIGRNVSWPAGWTQLFEAEEGSTVGADSRLEVGYRLADGNEGATFTVTISNDVASAHRTWRISGADDPSTGQAPEAAAKADGTGSCDPPSLTPTGGAKDYLWLALAGENATSGQSLNAAPANYTNFLSVFSTADSDNPELGVAERQLNAASEDPGAFGDNGDSLRWVATTVVVHPASGGGSTGPSTTHIVGVG